MSSDRQKAIQEMPTHERQRTQGMSGKRLKSDSKDTKQVREKVSRYVRRKDSRYVREKVKV